MKVRIGDKTYDSKTEPILLLLDGEDKKRISKLDPTMSLYACFPKGSTEKDVTEWMNRGIALLE